MLKIEDRWMGAGKLAEGAGARDTAATWKSGRHGRERKSSKGWGYVAAKRKRELRLIGVIITQINCGRERLDSTVHRHGTFYMGLGFAYGLRLPNTGTSL